MAMDPEAIQLLVQNLPPNLQHVHFEGMDGSRELSFTISPGTENELPVVLNHRNARLNSSSCLSGLRSRYGS